MVDHDRLFKELLTTFFVDFIDLFLPQVADYLDKESLAFFDKELFTEGKRQEADVVVRAKFKGHDSCFIIHTEAQAQHQPGLSKRLFSYFMALHEKFDLPVYPIALLSFEAPAKEQPSFYSVRFPDCEVLRFNYTVIQLNRLSWRRYLKRPNPVAAALMSRMRIAQRDRSRVKLQCWRLLMTLQLDWPKQRIISAFIETYLELTAEEMKKYEKALNSLDEPEREEIMEIETSSSREGRRLGRQEGLQEGLQKGMCSMIIRQMNRRFGELNSSVIEHVQSLLPGQLEVLSDTLPEFNSVADLDHWLNSQKP